MGDIKKDTGDLVLALAIIGGSYLIVQALASAQRTARQGVKVRVELDPETQQTLQNLSEKAGVLSKQLQGPMASLASRGILGEVKGFLDTAKEVLDFLSGIGVKLPALPKEPQPLPQPKLPPTVPGDIYPGHGIRLPGVSGWL